MKLAFACPHCASRLTVDSGLAGRIGRCRSCGRRVTVPEGAAAAKLTPVTATATKKKPPSPPPPAKSREGDYHLRPVTPIREPAIEVPGWDTDTSEMVVVRPPVPVADRRRETEPSPLLRVYRSCFSLLVKGTTWISETSYTVSLILLILSIAGGMIGRHALAAFGVKAIVILNLVGLTGDVASLVNLSFRKDPLRGALFLFPPTALYFLWTDWRRYRETVGRMRIPLVTLAVVGSAYLFVPWLSGGPEQETSVVATAERVVGDLEERLGGERGQMESRLKEARSWLREEVSHPPSPPAPGPDGGDPSVPDKAP